MTRQSSTAELSAGAEALAAANSIAAELLSLYGPPTLPRAPMRKDRFRSLVGSIAAQQVSGKAAASIFQRVVDIVGEDFNPQRAIDVGFDGLRSAGLSGSKAASVLDLAEHSLSGSVRLEALGSMDDHDVIDMLIQVRGIGVWTAQMVLIFDLRRIDVWPTGDLGVRVGFANAFGLETPPTPSELATLGEEFAPYRSVMAWWSWRATGTPVGDREKRQNAKPRPDA